MKVTHEEGLALQDTFLDQFFGLRTCLERMLKLVLYKAAINIMSAHAYSWSTRVHTSSCER